MAGAMMLLPCAEPSRCRSRRRADRRLHANRGGARACPILARPLSRDADERSPGAGARGVLRRAGPVTSCARGLRRKRARSQTSVKRRPDHRPRRSHGRILLRALLGAPGSDGLRQPSLQSITERAPPLEGQVAEALDRITDAAAAELAIWSPPPSSTRPHGGVASGSRSRGLQAAVRLSERRLAVMRSFAAHAALKWIREIYSHARGDGAVA